MILTTYMICDLSGLTALQMLNNWDTVEAFWMKHLRKLQPSPVAIELHPWDFYCFYCNRKRNVLFAPGITEHSSEAAKQG